nr:CYTH domain-containing protein [Leucobacter exalbidus]
MELERKYEVSGDTPLPATAAFAAAGFTASAPQTHELVATYFDTPGHDLATRGLALRSRAGGKDAGWHLKERTPEGVRELGWEPSTTMPAGVIAELGARIGENAALVAPAAEIRTTRVITMLREIAAATGSAADTAAAPEVIELADDQVLAIDHVQGVRRAWREWEAELMPGADAALLDVVEPVLLAAGATHSLSFAKIARATGQLSAAARAAGATAAQLAALAELDVTDRAAAQE